LVENNLGRHERPGFPVKYSRKIFCTYGTKHNNSFFLYRYVALTGQFSSMIINKSGEASASPVAFKD